LNDAFQTLLYISYKFFILEITKEKQCNGPLLVFSTLLLKRFYAYKEKNAGKTD